MVGADSRVLYLIFVDGWSGLQGSIFDICRWLERTPGLVSDNFNFTQKYQVQYSGTISGVVQWYNIRCNTVVQYQVQYSGTILIFLLFISF